jgi:hypothetical protein
MSCLLIDFVLLFEHEDIISKFLDISRVFSRRPDHTIDDALLIVSCETFGRALDRQNILIAREAMIAILDQAELRIG